MVCPHGVLACANATVPDTAWWLSMLQVFVPVVSALGLAVLGYRFTLRSDLRGRRTEARLSIQRQALEDAQQSLMTFWGAAAKQLRTDYQARLDNKDLLFAMEDASAAVTVAYSRLVNRKLADDMADWHFATSKSLRSPAAWSQDEVAAAHASFVALSNRLGVGLRELTAID